MRTGKDQKSKRTPESLTAEWPICPSPSCNTTGVHVLLYCRLCILLHVTTDKFEEAWPEHDGLYVYSIAEILWECAVLPRSSAWHSV